MLRKLFLVLGLLVLLFTSSGCIVQKCDEVKALELERLTLTAKLNGCEGNLAQTSNVVSFKEQEIKLLKTQAVAPKVCAACPPCEVNQTKCRLGVPEGLNPDE